MKGTVIFIIMKMGGCRPESSFYSLPMLSPLWQHLTGGREGPGGNEGREGGACHGVVKACPTFLASLLDTWKKQEPSHLGSAGWRRGQSFFATHLSGAKWREMFLHSLSALLPLSCPDIWASTGKKGWQWCFSFLFFLSLSCPSFLSLPLFFLSFKIIIWKHCLWYQNQNLYLLYWVFYLLRKFF